MNFISKRIKNIFTDQAARSFLIIILVFGVSTGLFMGVLNNFLHEVLHISRLERGIIELPREAPGLLLVLVVALLYKLCEIRILRLTFLLAITGIVGLAVFGEIRSVAIVMIVLWSAGEHLLMPLRHSIAIHFAQKGREGLAMGAVRSLQNMGQLAGYYFIPLLFLLLPRQTAAGDDTPFFYFQAAFIFAGVVLLGGFLSAVRLPVKQHHIDRKRLYFHKKYWRYYVLEMFFGARKQVFLTFAPYVLIVRYGLRTEVMALLYGVFATINIFASPQIGRWIDKFGYRIVIIIDTVILIVLCLLYGFSHHIFPHKTALWVVCGVFVLDSVLFVVAMARAMYVKTISGSQNELTATLSTGISINHLVSIIIAVLGGVLWEMLGVELLFSFAAAFGVGSFVFSLKLPKVNHH